MVNLSMPSAFKWWFPIPNGVLNLHIHIFIDWISCSSRGSMYCELVSILFLCLCGLEMRIQVRIISIVSWLIKCHGVKESWFILYFSFFSHSFLLSKLCLFASFAYSALGCTAVVVPSLNEHAAAYWLLVKKGFIEKGGYYKIRNLDQKHFHLEISTSQGFVSI